MSNHSVVAIEYNDETSTIVRYYADGSTGNKPYHRWLVSPYPPSDARGVLRQQKLHGNNPLRHRIWYRDKQSFSRASGMVRGLGGVVFFDPVQQYLADHPNDRLFNNMKFEELKRMVIDIETTGLHPETDRILCIGFMCSNGRGFVLDGTEYDIIVRLNELINEEDPDTIEGWNIYGFDLGFIQHRARQLGLSLNWGRDGSCLVHEKDKQFRVGSYTRSIQYWTCHGRHIIDGMLVAMKYDSNIGGKFESYSLKHVALVLGVRQEDRLILDRGTLEEQWETNQEDVKKYCLQDCLETLDVISIIVQPDFYLTSLMPDSFQHLTVSGGATKINQMLLSEYIQNNESIPLGPTECEEFEGGYVELRNAGVFHSVSKVDVSSLYPSIMIEFDVTPRQDTLGVFKQKLIGLTQKRLELKRLVDYSVSEADKIYYRGMDKAYKVVINSFYGYMGTSGMHFADFEMAGRVTETGRSIVCDMAEQLEAMGLLVIEVDTDGIYFQHDTDFPTRLIPETLILPEGIRVDIEEAYKSMIAVKAKNYVLVTEEKTVFHGNSLRSRRDEKFGQQFLEAAFKLLLKDEVDGLYELYEFFQMKIINREFSVNEMVKRERLSEKTFTSPLKKRLAAAAAQTDVVEGEYLWVYTNEAGELVPEQAFDGDYNRFCYLDRLFKFAQRIQPVLDVYGVILPRMPKRHFTKVYGEE